MSLAAGRRAPVEMTPEQIEQELRGYIAPALRRVKPELMQRRVTFVAKDGSTKPGVYGDALKGLATAHELEHTPAEGVKAKDVLCEFCRKVVPQPKCGLRKSCTGGCDRQATCASDGCLASPVEYSFTPGAVRARHGAPWVCPACASRRALAARTPEQRSASARRGRAAMTPEQRSAAARKATAARTPEQRSAAARKANAVRTPEQRSAAARKATAARTSESRSEATRKANAARRANAAKKATP